MPADTTPGVDPVAAKFDCRSREPIRGNAHAHRLLAVHADHHRCPRYQLAVDYAQEARP